jgi:hypothetical protein
MAKSAFDRAAVLVLNPDHAGHSLSLPELYGIPATTTVSLAPHQMTSPGFGLITIVFPRDVPTTHKNAAGEREVYRAGQPYLQPASNWIPAAPQVP